LGVFLLLEEVLPGHALVLGPLGLLLLLESLALAALFNRDLVAFHPILEGKVAAHDLEGDILRYLVLTGKVSGLLA
jgi:hypothetical protein